jgi:23S rRNA (uracil1939-C5)-methyltransferase
VSKQPTEIVLSISRLSDQGLGGGEHNERQVWVRNALPGEVAKARILKRRGGQRFADGHPIDKLSADRVSSPCTYFPRCGGCVTHHMSPNAQLAHKQQQLSEQLKLQQIEALSWRAPVSLLRLGYRRRARLGVRVVGDQVLVGFRESFSNRVARLDACLTLTPELSRLISPLKQTVGELSDPRTIPQIELAQGDDRCAVIVRHLQPLTAEDMQVWRYFERRWAVQVLSQSKGYDTLRGISETDLDMQLLHYQIPEYGVTLGFFPHQFTQVNAPMNRELVRTVMGYLGTVRGRSVLDMFCGIGNFTLPLARAGALAVGIEASDDAVARARANAQENALLDKSQFYATDLYGDAGTGRAIHAQLEALPKAMILDPPRSGAGPNLESWVSIQSLQKVVYVSCNPITFAEDAKVLVAAGYALRQVGVYDMFPGTAHVETVGYFSR